MTCRVARSFHNHTQMEPAYCCECGSTYLEVFFTSIVLGPHLCPTCAQSMVECGAWKENLTRSPMKGELVA